MQWILNRVIGMSEPVLSIKNLSVAFVNAENFLQVTDDVSFDIFPSEFFALVGESGCGKSVTAMSILRLLPVPSAHIVSGSIIYKNSCAIDLSKISLKELRKIRGAQISCVFQEPMQALNPVLTIKKQLLEAYLPNAHFRFFRKNYSNAHLDEIKKQLLLAGFTDPKRILNSYPHELSGGMLQRVCIVMAMLKKPKIIIADEPTTALDVTVQAQVLSVLKSMAKKNGTAVLLITHNMGVVSEYADRVAVMYAGRIVESGNVHSVICNPMHPYTVGLMEAIPDNAKSVKDLCPIPGSVPQPKDFVEGCRFMERCAYCSTQCTNKPPCTKIIENETCHEVFCFNYNGKK